MPMWTLPWNRKSDFNLEQKYSDLEQKHNALSREFAEAREQQTATHLPIIAMTAYAMDDDRKRCLEAGMDAYLSKPFHAAKLFDAIARLMSPGPRQQ